ncbi:MAG: patatin-like phospholipase family protein [Thermoanaerobaculia bacterium]
MPSVLERLTAARRPGWLFTGGSKRCAFQIGVAELLDEIGCRPSALLGVSGGSWNAAAIAVGQLSRLRAYWRFFSRMPYIDLTNLFREDHSPFIFSELHRRAFDRYVGKDALAAAPTPVWVAITRLSDRTPRIVDLREHPDPFAVMMASNYLPFYYTHPVILDGETFGDGGIANNAPYEFLLEQGCDLVVVIAPGAEEDGGIFRNLDDWDHQIPDTLAEQVVLVRPRRRLPCSFTESRWDALELTMNIGYARAREMILGEDHSALTGIQGAGMSPVLGFLRAQRSASRLLTAAKRGRLDEAESGTASVPTGTHGSPGTRGG